MVEHVLKNYTLQRIVFGRTVYNRNSANRDNFDRFFYFNKQIPAETLVRIVQDNDSGSLGDRINEIQQPALVLWGRQDQIIPLEQGVLLNEMLQSSQLIVLDDCGHLPYLEMPLELSNHILQFLLSETNTASE